MAAPQATQAPQARAPNVDATIAELKKLYGERVSTAHAVREQHGKDISFHEAHLPDAVVFAESAEEVQQIVKLCARLKTPIIAFGTGTSLEGHISAPNGGISLDVSRMNRVLQVNEADLDVIVQPGVTRKQLNEHLRATGLFFPIDPGADASIGGMASTRASGTNAGAKEQAEMVQAIADEHGGGHFASTGQAEERSKMWQARHDAAWAAKASRPGWGMWATDVCVPISRLAECILETQKDIVAN